MTTHTDHSECSPCLLSCADCGRGYGEEHGFPDMIVPNDVWKLISPTGDEGGLICPCCIIRRCHKKGLSNVAARFTSGPCRINLDNQNGLHRLECTGKSYSLAFPGEHRVHPIEELSDGD